MERVNLDALEHMAEWFTHGHSARYDAHAKLVRTAIDEIRDLRQALTGRTVSCEACNGMAKRVAVLEEECRAGRELVPINRHGMAYLYEIKGDCGHTLSPIERSARLSAARRATDENGGLGA